MVADRRWQIDGGRSMIADPRQWACALQQFGSHREDVAVEIVVVQDLCSGGFLDYRCVENSDHCGDGNEALFLILLDGGKVES